MHTMRTLSAVIFALSFACAAFAQEDRNRTDRSPGDLEGGGRVIKSKTIVGYKVKNQAGENLGKIEELAIDPESGKIAYAVLSFGGFLGVGDKLFAIPWSALQPRHGEETFILNVDKEQLKNAPGFDKGNWPNMADRRWGQGIHDFYRSTPYWENREVGAANVRAESKKLPLDLDQGKAFVFQVEHGGLAARLGEERSGSERPSTERSTDPQRPSETGKLGKSGHGKMTYRLRVQDAPAIAGDTILLVTIDKGDASYQKTSPTQVDERREDRPDATQPGAATGQQATTKTFTVTVDSDGRIKSMKPGAVAAGRQDTASAPAAGGEAMEELCQKSLQCILGSGLHKETLQVGKAYDVCHAGAVGPRTDTSTSRTDTSTSPSDTSGARAGTEGKFGSHGDSFQLRYDGLTERGNWELARFSILGPGAGFSPASSRTETGAPSSTTRPGETSTTQDPSRPSDTPRSAESSTERALAGGQALGYALYRLEDGVLEELRVSGGKGGQASATSTTPSVGASFQGLTIRRLQ